LHRSFPFLLGAGSFGVVHASYDPAGLTDHLWSVADLVALLEREEAKLEHGRRINRADRT
jgi:hypothetical protein